MNPIKKNEPCNDCPFRRNSLPGWLGNHESSEEITDILNLDLKFPCHMHVNFLMGEDESLMSFEEACSQARHCVGGLAFMNNKCKLSQDKEIAALQKEVGKRDDCFAMANEMIRHHGC